MNITDSAVLVFIAYSLLCYCAPICIGYMIGFGLYKWIKNNKFKGE